MAFHRARPVLLTLLLLACSGPSIEQFTPKDADARSRAYIFQFARSRVDSAASRLVPMLRKPETSTELQKIADLLRDKQFDTIRVIGAGTNVINGTRHVNLTYELHSPSRWFLANVATVDTAGTWFVEGVSARPLAQPLEVAAQFSFNGKSVVHYVWLILSMLCATISLGSAAFIATRGAMPRRWRWAMLSLLGVGAFRLNWTTGGVDVALLQVQVLSASFVRAGPAAPWILSFALPIGAIFGLRKYWQWQTGPEQTRDNETSLSEAAK